MQWLTKVLIPITVNSILLSMRRTISMTDMWCLGELSKGWSLLKALKTSRLPEQIIQSNPLSLLIVDSFEISYIL